MRTNGACRLQNIRNQILRGLHELSREAPERDQMGIHLFAMFVVCREPHCSATIKMRTRVASFENAPKSLDHCLIEMLPTPS